MTGHALTMELSPLDAMTRNQPEPSGTTQNISTPKIQNLCSLSSLQGIAFLRVGHVVQNGMEMSSTLKELHMILNYDAWLS